MRECQKGRIQGAPVPVLVSDDDARLTTALSFDLPDAICTVLADVPGIIGLRLLEARRDPKLFVIIDDLDMDREMEIIRRLIRIEDIKPSSTLTYDILPQDRIGFIPDDARPIG